jgi:hypothetical protein
VRFTSRNGGGRDNCQIEDVGEVDRSGGGRGWLRYLMNCNNVDREPWPAEPEHQSWGVGSSSLVSVVLFIIG